MEEQKRSLPSISNLLGLINLDLPPSESSSTSWQHRPEFGVSPLLHGRAGSELVKSPTPPTSPCTSFGDYSPESRTSLNAKESARASREYCYELTSQLEADVQGQAPSAATPRAMTAASAPYPTTCANQQPVDASHLALQEPCTIQLLQVNSPYQHSLPRAFSPLVWMPFHASSWPDAWHHHHYLNPIDAIPSSRSQIQYICPICNKVFGRPSGLRIHSHSHSGERPFKCSRCGKAFSVRSNMRRHEKGCHTFKFIG